MTPADLSRDGWVCRLGDPDGRAVISGERMAVSRIRAAITRLPQVTAPEIANVIAPPDREYAAAEMTAFLAAWLMTLGDRVLNPPTPTFLHGELYAEELLREWATGAGLAAKPTSATAATTVSCIDGVAVSPAGPFADSATRIARATGQRLLRVHLDQRGGSLALTGCDPFVDLDKPSVAAAVLKACG